MEMGFLVQVRTNKLSGIFNVLMIIVVFQLESLFLPSSLFSFPITFLTRSGPNIRLVAL